MRQFLLAGILAVLVWSCTEAPDFDVIPEITFDGISQNTLAQSIPLDTVMIALTITDADGDLGSRGSGDQEFNVFMIDEIDSFEAARFQLPMFSQQGIGKGIKAEVTLRYIVQKGDICCRQSDGSRRCDPSITNPVDSLFYDTYVVDHAGNESNHIRVGPVYLTCDDPQ